MLKLNLVVMALLVLTGCTHSVSKFYPEIVPKKSEAAIQVNPGGNHQLSIVYLGCGNLVLEQNGEAVITDPFFFESETP